MIATNNFEKLRLAFLWLVSIILTSFLVLRNTLSNDGRIYFEAGKSVNNGFSAWNSNLDPFAQYLYGPINAVLNSFLARNSYEVFVLLIKLATCALLFYTVKKFILNINHVLVAYILCCCSFSVRSNMQYAAIGGLGSLLFVLTLRANSRVTDKWSSAMAVLLLDFKPHIYWFSTFLLRGKKRILMFLSLALTTYVLIYFLRNDMSFVNWIRTISERKNGLTSDPTLISPAFVLFHNFVPMYVLLAIHVLTVLSILTMCKKYSLNLEATAIATYAGALATTPYLHTIDTLGVALLALVNILRREKINIVNLLLVFANCLWSTSAVFSVAFIVLVILVLHISNKLSNTKLSVLVGAIWAILLHLITQILEINQIPSWYYSLVLVLNIYAIFNMRSAQNA